MSNIKRQDHIKLIQTVIANSKLSRQDKIAYIKRYTEQLYDQDIANQFATLLEYSGLSLHHSTTLDQVINVLVRQARKAA